MTEKFRNRYRIASTRASWWDYGRNGAYFITICTAHREHYFGEIVDNGIDGCIMKFSSVGRMAHNNWLEIPTHFPFVVLDSFVVMPNHVHGIIIIEKLGNDSNGVLNGKNVVGLDGCRDVACNASTANPSSNPPTDPPFYHQYPLPNTVKNQKMAKISPKQDTVSTIIRSYKSALTKYCNNNHLPFAWQSRFHDHIIRDDGELKRIRHYIINNPSKWPGDKFYR